MDLLALPLPEFVPGGPSGSMCAMAHFTLQLYNHLEHPEHLEQLEHLEHLEHLHLSHQIIILWNTASLDDMCLSRILC